MNWISNNWVELFGALAGVLFVFLEIRQNILLWPVGIITSLVYIRVFYSTGFYADMSLQFYYLAISFYGWYWWLKGGRKGNAILQITRIQRALAMKLTAITLALWFIIWYLLRFYTDSPVPVGDAFTTALSITATWMLAHKIREHWLVWVIVNAVSLILYLYKGLYPTAGLFIVYFIMAIVGWYSWRIPHSAEKTKTVGNV